MSQRRIASKMAGFTLVELVIAVAIVAILAAIALPSYSAYVRRGNRTVAKSVLSEILQKQEGFAIDHKRYTGSLTDLGYAGGNFLNSQGTFQAAAAGSIYEITLGSSNCGASGATGTVAAGTGTLFVGAVRSGTQVNDTCGTLCLSSSGVRTVSAGTVADCWGR